MNVARFFDLLAAVPASTLVEQDTFIDRRAEAVGIGVAIHEVKREINEAGYEVAPGELD